MSALDDKGRCCGRKLMHYKGGSRSFGVERKFCPRCDRQFHPETGEQVENWAWRFDGEQWISKVLDRGTKP